METLADLAHPDAWEWYRVEGKDKRKPQRPKPRARSESIEPSVLEKEQLALF